MAFYFQTDCEIVDFLPVNIYKSFHTFLCTVNSVIITLYEQKKT